MILRSEPTIPGTRSGFSMLEALIVLAILALVAGVSLPMLRGPSPELLLSQRAAGIAAQIAQARLAATRTGEVQTIEVPELACDNSGGKVLVFADGVVAGSDLCLIHGTAKRQLQIAPLTGHLVTVVAP